MKSKSLINNSIYNVLYKVLNVIFPLISVSYVAHILMPEGVGKVASAQNITQYFVLIAALGIPNYGTREIAKVKGVFESTKKVFSELYIINFLSTIFCTIIYYTLVLNGSFFANELSLYLITGSLIILNIFNVDWYYQGTEEYQYIAIRSFLIKILSLILLVFGVRSADDYCNYAMISTIAVGGNYILNMINLRRKGIYLVFSSLDIKKHIKPVLILLCTTIAIELYTLLDTTMITIYCDAENVAYYSNSMKVVRILITVIAAIGGVLLPRLSYYRKQNMVKECNEVVNKVFYIMFFFFLPCGVGLIATAPEIVEILFGNAFLPAASTLRISALLVYALGFSNLFGTQILLTFDREKELLFSTIIGAVINVCLNLILIPRFYHNGAAFASVVSETIVTMSTYYFSSKCLQIKYEKKIIGPSVISCAVMLLFITLSKCVNSSSMGMFIIQVVFSVFIYVCCNFALKNKILNEFINIIKKRR